MEIRKFLLYLKCLIFAFFIFFFYYILTIYFIIPKYYSEEKIKSELLNFTPFETNKDDLITYLDRKYDSKLVFKDNYIKLSIKEIKYLFLLTVARIDAYWYFNERNELIDLKIKIVNIEIFDETMFIY